LFDHHRFTVLAAFLQIVVAGFQFAGWPKAELDAGEGMPLHQRAAFAATRGIDMPVGRYESVQNSSPRNTGPTGLETCAATTSCTAE
jgi:hypothetical protein